MPPLPLQLLPCVEQLDPQGVQETRFHVRLNPCNTFRVIPQILVPREDALVQGFSNMHFMCAATFDAECIMLAPLYGLHAYASFFMTKL